MENLLSKDQQIVLLRLARQTIKHHLKTGKTLKVQIRDEALKIKRGVFVTLKRNDELRGCVGYPLPHKALFETVIESAISAATQDFRFQSIEAEELDEIKIEISILTLPQVAKDISKIEVGKHGIIISKGPHKGLLLPQVPVEWNWNLETYLNHGCLKAGLGKNEWKKGARIEIFSAQVFSED